MVAQPAFAMRARRSQDEETLLNATSFAAESVCCWNFSTQIGVSAATTAVSARWVAIFSAVLPSVHPSDENPTTVNATAPTTAPHTAGFTPGWTFISSPSLWEKGLLPVATTESYQRDEPATVDSELLRRRRPASNVGYRRLGYGACPPGGACRSTLSSEAKERPRKFDWPRTQTRRACNDQ